MLPCCILSSQSRGQNSYLSDDLPKNVVMTLCPGSTDKSKDFHRLQQILLLGKAVFLLTCTQNVMSSVFSQILINL